MTSKKPSKKKPAKTMAPMPASKLARINKAREKDGKEPLTAVEAGATDKNPVAGQQTPKKGKPEKAIVPVIAPSETPVNDILADKTKWGKGGALEITKDLTEGEGVALVSMFANTAKSAGEHIGTVIAHLEKKHKTSYESVALATGLEVKTLQNMAHTMRNVKQSVIAAARKIGEKAGHELNFTVIKQVASLPAADQTAILNKAAEEGLSVSQVRAEVVKVAPPSPQAKAAKKKRTTKARAAAVETLTDLPLEGSEPSQPEFQVITHPLSPDDQALFETAVQKADDVVTFLKSRTCLLLSKDQLRDLLNTIKPMLPLYNAKVEELAEPA